MQYLTKISLKKIQMTLKYIKSGFLLRKLANKRGSFRWSCLSFSVCSFAAEDKP